MQTINPSSCEIEFSLPDGKWITVNKYHKSRTIDSDSGLGKLLHVTGYVCRPHFVDSAWLARCLSCYTSPGNGLFAVLKYPEDSGYWLHHIIWDYNAPKNFQINDNHLVLLLVGAKEDRATGKFLILSPFKNGFKRVGYAEEAALFPLSKDLDDDPTSSAFVERHRTSRFEGEDLHWSLWGHKVLKRTDEEFTAMSVKRTIILE
ncbi:hypothetical protein CC86DRAFT_407570 [Ophiobolus disseminans]|uniref:Uncharacterized protein n=1 Tax=Ophiobolus disseminans TaxID=1469910 RepID=A0A6A6ZWC6_9PLEO|nr:hypothetical protein CC86DRAFT_407570 [Ophiobolus disseminans]